MTGMPVSDDSFDYNHKLVIDHKKVFITFDTDETTLYFYSIVLTQRGITKCNHIIVTGGTEWGNQLVRLAPVRTKEEEESHKIC